VFIGSPDEGSGFNELSRTVPVWPVFGKALEIIDFYLKIPLCDSNIGSAAMHKIEAKCLFCPYFVHIPCHSRSVNLACTRPVEIDR
jgi:hypothetical protein